MNQVSAAHEQADPHALVLNLPGGVRLRVPANVAEASTYVLLEQEDWFEKEIGFVRHCLRPGMHAIDAGASYGTYTAAMARAVGPGGGVVAFEPTAAVARYLEQTLSLNEMTQVRLYRQALSDRTGRIELEAGALSETNRVSRNGAGGAARIDVDATALDDLASRGDWHDPDFFKLDVEGHELAVLEGGRGLLQRASPLLMLEVRTGANLDLRPLEMLAAMGYRPYRLLPGLLVLVPVEPDQALCPYELNLFACKDDRAARLEAEGLLARDGGPGGGTAPRDAWAEYARSTPYARGLVRRWPARGGSLFAPHRNTYMEGLACFALSRDRNRSAAERVAWLLRATDLLAEAMHALDGIARRISYARTAWEAGQRSLAVQTLEQAGRRLQQQTPDIAREPFLSPCPRYDAIEAGRDPNAWLQCAVLEQYEKLHVFSSCFSPDSSRSIVEAIARYAFRSPEMERRRQLIRMRAGLQRGPLPVEILSRASEENLNPGYWMSGGAA